MIDTAAVFPTDRKDVCQWAEDNFSEYICICQRVQAELRKYNRPLDVDCLCDGIVYLSAYAKYRRQEITEELYGLYAERKHWEIQGCGKETLKLHRDVYTVSHNGRQYILDYHIKRGIRAEEMLRIYFFWDEDERRVVIGSMPEHLPTVKNTT